MVVVLAQPSQIEKPKAQDLLALRQVFAAVHAESCPHTYNFHLHTTHSDGQLQPSQLIDQALEIGLRGLAITDHHQVTGFYAAERYLQDWQAKPENHDKPSPHLWIGTEITSQLLETEVHILAYAFDPCHPAIVGYLQGAAPRDEAAQARNVVSAIHQSGGVAVLAHPMRYRRSYEILIPAAVMIGIDGVEAYYAYGNPKPWKASPEETQLVRQLSDRYRLMNTCGTDTHGSNIRQRV